MLFSYNWLKDYIFGKLPRPEKLAELLTSRAFEVGEVKKSGQDFILDIDVLPNRASDCFSHLGMAREIAAISGLQFRPPSFKLKTSNQNQKTTSLLRVENAHPSFCSRYSARVIKGVKIAPSPKWLKERLKICGLRSINNIVDITNYLMLETGQPLHVFDLGKIASQKIIVRFAKTGEEIVTLDKEKYKLDEDILLIADAQGPLALAGIKGGKKAEIGKYTKAIVLESANFEPRTIRRGREKLGLKTEASLRFEHGLDPNLTELAINRAAFLIGKIAGGRLAEGLIDIYPQKVYPKIIKLSLDYLESLLGIKIPPKEIKKIFNSLGIKIIGQEFNQIKVEVPTFRLDLSLAEDLIEEIGRVYGYEKIKAKFPLVSLIPPKRSLEIFWENQVKDILKEAGFSEIYNYSFFGEREARIFGEKEKDLIEVANPLSREYKYLRTSLLPNLIKNLEKNLKYLLPFLSQKKEGGLEFKEIKIFELGKIFKNPKKVEEKKMLSGLLTGQAFYQAKGVVDLVLKKLGISQVWYDQYQPRPDDSKISIWHLRRSAEIKINHQKIGFLGEISPKILEDLKIPIKIVAFDLDFEKLSQLASEEQEYRPISKFPAAVRDLAILVPLQTRVVEVLNKINSAGGPLIRDIDLFDIYEGQELPEGKKNLAFHIIYQSERKTLSSQEIVKIHNKIVKALEKEPDWEVRK